MTAEELREQKIIPMRVQLNKLEEEYRKLYRKECGEKIGKEANCNNCAFSCILDIGDHNYCMGEKCVCCHSWCYNWIPENEVSKFLRKNYHYDASLFYRFEKLFGDYFLEKCNNPNNAAKVMTALSLVSEFDGTLED